MNFADEQCALRKIPPRLVHHDAVVPGHDNNNNLETLTTRAFSLM